MEKENGIKYSYAWLDKHPDVRVLVAIGFEANLSVNIDLEAYLSKLIL